MPRRGIFGGRASLASSAVALPSGASSRHSTLLALSLIILLALVARCALLGTPGHVDEFYSGLAARGIAEHGIPLFPSGLYYNRDLGYHYALAMVLEVGGAHLSLGRWLSIAVGLAVVPLTYALVHRLSASRGAGLLAALLVALDPFTVSMTPRMRMYPWLQVASLALLLTFERDFVQRAAMPREWKWRTAVVWCASLLVHHLALFFAPALAFVAWQQWRKASVRAALPWRGVLVVGVGTAVALALPRLALEHARAHPLFEGTVAWGSTAHTSAVQAYLDTTDLFTLYQHKLAASAPANAKGMAKAFLWLALAGFATFVLSRLQSAGRRLALYLWAPLAMLALYPHYELPPRWLVHLAPLWMAVAAWAAWAFVHHERRERELFSKSLRYTLVILAGLSAIAVLNPRSGLWPWRYVFLSLLACTGILWGARERHSLHRLAWRAASSVAAGAVLLWVHMSLGLWWTHNGAWVEAGRQVAPLVEPDDLIVVAGDCPSVTWALGRVDAAIPFWRLEYARGAGGSHDSELTSGARVLRSVDELERLERGRRVWFFGQFLAPGQGSTKEIEHYASVEAPLLEWVIENTYPVKSFDHSLQVRLSAPVRLAGEPVIMPGLLAPSAHPP